MKVFRIVRDRGVEHELVGQVLEVAKLEERHLHAFEHRKDACLIRGHMTAAQRLVWITRAGSDRTCSRPFQPGVMTHEDRTRRVRGLPSRARRQCCVSTASLEKAAKIAECRDHA